MVVSSGPMRNSSAASIVGMSLKDAAEIVTLQRISPRRDGIMAQYLRVEVAR